MITSRLHRFTDVKKISVVCYILDSNHNLKGSIQSKVEPMDIFKEVKRVKDEELYLIKYIKDDEEVDVGYDENCLYGLMLLVQFGHLTSYKSERGPKGKFIHQLEFQFKNGSGTWRIIEQTKPANLDLRLI
ncbi:hypothetical protein SAMN06265827_10585 [Orenia metallireducens]|uniref:Uncharacterized protein n=1 Tax=Orenia metallireducens TaxID=1413210 RepID=A0A285G6M5_9FIRM|nr:hypothetical protein [Orenia metallireducens]SNY19232.1 hypothetical protein SAMN06265827_10585 [Orenia metallireducens]